MRVMIRLLPLLAALPTWAADDTTSSGDKTTTSVTGKGMLTLDGTITGTISDAATPTGSYQSITSTVTLGNGHGSVAGSHTVTGSDATVTTPSNSTDTKTSTSNSLTVLAGSQTHLINGTANATMTASASASSSPVINTQPCNGYPEFCARNYSNITVVAAHNSPFVKPGSVAANQALLVETQLNDGIRMLQFQTHLVNNTLYLCHSNCELLNVGTLEAYLTTVAKWMKAHPYDVVTILMGNSDYVDPGNFTAPVQNSGLMDLVYTPSKIPMALDDWPTLSTMIMSGKRAVMFLDYQANQTAYPWLMDEFSQMWETPFSPTDRAFPCTVQRPPDLAEPDAKNRMYMANHNLNLQMNVLNLNLLIPNTALLNETNAVEGYGSLGWMAGNCTEQWNRPPNFLLVDYYNYGPQNGSVFEVAAKMNNVTWNGKCCGVTSAGLSLTPQSVMATALMIGGIQFLVSMF
ncbi:PLC-like phosphodiesterase [Aspergillus alliaceus]|uniref:PLC-like phosphodiesterase n=1 Tax=Petromyces alliaceus TaxID=209559 RepID=UPI0012A3CD5D|nr:PLC-like phosphodiesterase [Aspergillus alliaceus]KAB8227745.1 PLC-like phosphodiesterase [Aspergillus alliaceus]